MKDKIPSLISISLVCIMLMAGCVATKKFSDKTNKLTNKLLSYSENITPSPFKTYEEAATVYRKITLGDTTEDKLKEIGFHPSYAGVSLGNYLTEGPKFLYHESIKQEDLAVGVQKFLEAKENGVAYSIDIPATRTGEEGSVLLNWCNFKKVKRQTGWIFKATLLLVKDTETEKMVVVYKTPPVGDPNIDVPDKEVNPLGPFQNVLDWGWKIGEKALTK